MGQPPYLAFALVKACSHWNQSMVVYDPLQFSFYNKKGGSGSTEIMLQRCRWGLFQIYGVVARKLGFSGPLTDLVRPDVNIHWGVRHMADLSVSHRGAKLVLAFIGADLTSPSPKDMSTLSRVVRYEEEYSRNALLSMSIPVSTEGASEDGTAEVESA